MGIRRGARLGAATALMVGLAAACTPPQGGTGLPPPDCYNNNSYSQSLGFNGGTTLYNTAVYNEFDCQGSIADYWHIVWAVNLTDAELKCLALPDPGLVASNLAYNGYDVAPEVWACRGIP